ncbi:MAG TPA: hypothetical protein VK788_24070 [Terriglobales bacterium]|nr:hypothetical protein [Terriglobales bacterium]
MDRGTIAACLQGRLCSDLPQVQPSPQITGESSNCPNEQQQYCHDFGSILNFIEYAFGNNGQPLHFAGSPPTSGISPSYSYADVFAPDGSVVCGANCSQPYSLSDFFSFGGGPRTFIPFTQGVNYPTQCFITPTAQGCFGSNFEPADPDADAVDPQD